MGGNSLTTVTQRFWRRRKIRVESVFTEVTQTFLSKKKNQELNLHFWIHLVELLSLHESTNSYIKSDFCQINSLVKKKNPRNFHTYCDITGKQMAIGSAHSPLILRSLTVCL